jgi:predicted small metal-binding protein
MTTIYVINCRDVGVDCEFATQAGTIEAVIEQCAEHGRTAHGMTSFGPALYAKMRGCIQTLDEDSSRFQKQPN